MGKRCPRRAEVLNGHPLDAALAEKAQLLGLLASQDVEQAHDGVFRTAPKVAQLKVQAPIWEPIATTS